jgi:hypothetical protein
MTGTATAPALPTTIPRGWSSTSNAEDQHSTVGDLGTMPTTPVNIRYLAHCDANGNIKALYGLDNEAAVSTTNTLKENQRAEHYTE